MLVRKSTDPGEDRVVHLDRGGCFRQSSVKLFKQLKEVVELSVCQNDNGKNCCDCRQKRAQKEACDNFGILPNVDERVDGSSSRREERG